MNLQDAYDYLGQLLNAGVPGDIPFASLVEGMPCEIHDFVLATGRYHGDALPKLIPYTHLEGASLVAIPVGEYVEHLCEPQLQGGPPWEVEDLPVECLCESAARRAG